MLLFLKTYWKAIAIVLLLVLTNVATYQRTSLYVNTQWELKWSEASVDALKSTIEEQNKEIEKQNQLLVQQEKQNVKDEKRNQELAIAADSANKSVGMLKQQLKDLLSKRGASESATSDIARAANAATDRLVLSELLSHCAERYRRMAETADRARNTGLSCQEQYNSVKAIINGEKQ